MKNLLVVKSSINAEQSKSNQLLASFLELHSSQATVVERNLGKDVLPHLSQEEMGAWMTPKEERTAQQHNLAALSDTLISEVQAADTLVIGMPMYNFGVSSNFKSWVDRIARAGVTFKYTETGPVGLLANKKVIIVATRGGMYQGTLKDSQTQYLKDFFAFIGLTDVRFIYAEGLNMPNGELSFASAREALRSVSI